MLGTVDINLMADSDVTVVSNKKGKLTGTLTDDNYGRAFIFTPDHPFPESDTITVRLSPNIMDTYGDFLDYDFDLKV